MRFQERLIILLAFMRTMDMIFVCLNKFLNEVSFLFFCRLLCEVLNYETVDTSKPNKNRPINTNNQPINTQFTQVIYLFLIGKNTY